uniref:3-hydroxybenzoate 6-hydroxylase 1 n=2 Tax=Anthurium amnicola TaxID=1678845 RepID=A0A1D1XJY2_9ARAE
MGHPDEQGIVIAGGGICGLAAALALHRKGVKSIVLEGSNTLRATGGGIGIFSNGWRALDQLGIGTELRRKSILTSMFRDVNLRTGELQERLCGNTELRCLKRSDLIEALANGLPHGSIRFGCKIVAVAEDSATSFPLVYLHDGSIISAKVLIGCDGVNSVVAKTLGLKDPRPFRVWTIRGFTNYTSGHSYGSVFTRLLGGSVTFGMIPIDDNLMHWFLSFRCLPDDSRIEDSEQLRDLAMKLVEGFPADASQMVEDSDVSSLSFTSIRYRAPWDFLFCNICKGTTTVVGDAMHVMGPFIGQGGSCGLEDTIVLARNLAEAMQEISVNEFDDRLLQKRVAVALDNYVKERKLRVLRLSTQTYLIGMLIYSPSKVTQFFVFVLLVAFFGGKSFGHSRYDCGQL